MKLLLVDDDPDILALAALALETIGGFSVMKAECAVTMEAAVDQETPDAIILDFELDGVSGPELLSQLRERPELKTQPAIFITAKADSLNVDDYRELGVKGILKKPFEPRSLPDDVRRLLES
ncbi:MAG: response regulator [Candidatus Hinthialibacter antarcticus]|nr:response regulator [Candidatus Hinthialibacter antarcticus]